MEHGSHVKGLRFTPMKRAESRAPLTRLRYRSCSATSRKR